MSGSVLGNAWSGAVYAVRCIAPGVCHLALEERQDRTSGAPRGAPRGGSGLGRGDQRVTSPWAMPPEGFLLAGPQTYACQERLPVNSLGLHRGLRRSLSSFSICPRSAAETEHVSMPCLIAVRLEDPHLGREREMARGVDSNG